MKDTTAAETPIQTDGERDTPTTAQVKNENGDTKEGAQRNKEESGAHGGLGSRMTGKNFVMLEERLRLNEDIQ